MIDTQQEMQSTITAAAQVMSKMAGTANVDAVFGQPVERGETLVIPCAEVSMAGGIGVGRGPSAGTEQRKLSIGEGGGGGGNGTGRPIAVIVMSPQGVRVEPILDATKVALAAFTMATFILFWLGRLARVSRADQGKEPSPAQLKKAIEG